MSKIKLYVGGVEYYINTDDEESYVQNLGYELNNRLAKLREKNPILSTTMAAVLAALEYSDEAKKSHVDAENLRMQMKGYIEDCASARLEADEARREIERLNRENQNLRNKLNNQ